jgi:hypothetical protein
MLGALPGGEREPAALADLARGRRREELPALRRAFAGRVKPRPPVLSGQLLAHIDVLDGVIAELHDQIERQLAPFAGVKEVAAAAIVSEIGADMGRFPSAKHLASGAGGAPGRPAERGQAPERGDDQGRALAAGDAVRGRLGQRARQDHLSGGAASAPGAPARAAEGAPGGGPQPDVIICHVLSTQRPDHDLGPDYFDRLAAERIERRRVQRLEQLGYPVTLTPREAA